MIKLDIASSPPTASIATNPDTAARIIATMLHSDRTIPEIADEFRLSFAQMMALLETPEAKAEIEAIGKLSALRDQLRAPIRRETALHRLSHIVAYSLNEPEARRAASTLVKTQATATQPAPATQQTPETQQSTPNPLPLGTPSLREGTIATTSVKPASHRDSNSLPMCDGAMCDVPCDPATRERVPCDAPQYGPLPPIPTPTPSARPQTTPHKRAS
jgi:hypothetical protein